MKKINEQSTKVFCRLLLKLDADNYAKLQSQGYMPLVIEMIGENIQTQFGAAKLYSLAHHYVQNGDLMRDPEMVFIVVDNRKEKKDFENILIIPQMYQQDNLGIYEESINIQEGKLACYKKFWHDGHCKFAAEWLRTISRQGFLQ